MLQLGETWASNGGCFKLFSRSFFFSLNGNFILIPWLDSVRSFGVIELECASLYRLDILGVFFAAPFFAKDC